MTAYIITIVLLGAYAWMQSVILDDMDKESERLDGEDAFAISLSVTALSDGLHKRIRRQKRSALSIGLIILFLSPPQHITLALLALFVAYETYRFSPYHFLHMCVGYAEIKR